MSLADQVSEIPGEHWKPLPRGIIQRESELTARALSLLPAVGNPKFAYSRNWHCYVLEFLRLETNEQRGDDRRRPPVSMRTRFVPVRLDLFGLLGYLALLAGAPLGLFLSRATHQRDVALLGVVLGGLGLLLLIQAPRILRPNLLVLLNVVRDERKDARSVDAVSIPVGGEQATIDELEAQIELAEARRLSEERALLSLELLASARFLWAVKRWRN
jgi:hypothetical protein